MKFLPIESFIIETSLSITEIKEKLGNNIEPKKWWRFSGYEKYFEGEITENGFTISRNISYLNSFLPLIHGDIEEQINGVNIKVRMGLPPFIILFMVLWLAGVGISIFTVLPSAFNSPLNFPSVMLVTVGILLFGWGLIAVGFWPEVDKAKKLLFKILER